MDDDIALLVVDDDPALLSLSRIFLEKNGFSDISAVSSAEDALHLLGSRTFDVVVADYEMPAGMSGIAMLRTMRERGDDTPVIIFTGKSREEIAIEALNSGAAYYLEKDADSSVMYAELRNMIQNLAEKKRARELVILHEIELRRSNEELESFCYSVSHDLRAPLRVIEGYCSVIQDRSGKDFSPEVRMYFEGIRAASVRMNTMIESLLKFSRAGRFAITCVELDLSKVAFEITTSLQRQDPGRTAAITIDESMVVWGDRDLLTMALQNLLDNAWKYSSRRDHAEIAFRVSTTDGTRIFSIRDNGAGFDAAHAENLFKPFTRFHTESEFPGTGIGLATVNRIIERHGGRLWVESRAGEGATFYFTLPDCRISMNKEA